MHREIDPPFGQCFFNLLGEHALGADLGERNISNLVAGGLDDLQLDFVSTLAQQRGDVVRLPERQLRSARANSEGAPSASHLVFPLPTTSALRSLRAAFFASRRPNSLRTRSMTVVASDDSRAAVLSVVIGVCMILLMMPRVSASTAISCSGVSVPSRPRTRSISAWRTVSRCSCSDTMVGTTSSVCSRRLELLDLSCTMASARSASTLRSATCEDTTCCKIVDVVDEDAVQLVHLRIDVARDRNVDEEHGTIAAAAQELLAMLLAENGVRRAGRTDDDVGAIDRLIELLEREWPRH